MHMSKADFVETVLGGLRPIAIMCTCHDDVEVLRDTVQKWSNELVCASKAKETAVLAQQINNKQSEEIPGTICYQCRNCLEHFDTLDIAIMHSEQCQ